MIIFELCSGLLYRNLFYLRLACVAFERTSIVMPSVVGSNGHCMRIMMHTTGTNKSLFLEKQMVFTPGKEAETSNLETNCSMNR